MDKKTIALIAHDNKKPQIVKWATENSRTLSMFDLCGTGTYRAIHRTKGQKILIRSVGRRFGNRCVRSRGKSRCHNIFVGSSSITAARPGHKGVTSHCSCVRYPYCN